MRQDYALFEQRGATVLVVGPDGPHAFRSYWQEHEMPFPGLADLRSRVADQYYQEFNLLKLGRIPALFIIDRLGQIQYAHYGDSMKDIPTNAEVLSILDSL